MKPYFLLILTLLVGCSKSVPASCDDASSSKCPPCPCATGGKSATGGKTSVGGSIAAGGKLATGGSISTGGSASVVVVFPACNSTTEHALKAANHRKHKLGGKAVNPRNEGVKATPPVVGASVFWRSPCKALDQDVSPYTGNPTGSCTGNDATQVSSTPPFSRTCAQADERAALLCYQDATNIDNGCAWNATNAQCPNDFTPQTDANDNGSYGQSAFDAAIRLGWFRGTRAVVQTLQGWHDALLLGPCGFDQPWYNAGFAPTQCGSVALTGGLAGYHSTEMAGYDVPNQRMYGRNSWGDWGVEDGYFYYTFANQRALLAAGAVMVCPI